MNNLVAHVELIQVGRDRRFHLQLRHLVHRVFFLTLGDGPFGRVVCILPAGRQR
jgi:hypothetical protein